MLDDWVPGQAPHEQGATITRSVILCEEFDHDAWRQEFDRVHVREFIVLWVSSRATRTRVWLHALLGGCRGICLHYIFVASPRARGSRLCFFPPHDPGVLQRKGVILFHNGRNGRETKTTAHEAGGVAGSAGGACGVVYAGAWFTASCMVA